MADLDINVYESVSVGESASSNVAFIISVSESVTLSELIVFAKRMYTHPRLTPLYMPVWELDASFSPMMGLDKTMPIWSGSGFFGASLNKKMPTYSLEASMTEHLNMSLDKKTPFYTISGYFGSSLIKKIPVWTLDASISGMYIYLDKIMPGWKIEATMIGPNNASLDGTMPIWIIEASLNLSGMAMSLDKKIPFYKIEASILQGYNMSLDEKMPIWGIEASMYSGNMSLDATMPIWVMKGIGTGDVDGAPGDMSDPTRFDDYILQYERP